MATLFLTGATGFVGSHVAQTYAAAGARLRLLTRPTSNVDALEGIDAGAKARWLEAKGALDRLSDKLDDRLDPLNTGIAANGSSLNGISADIRDMRNHALGQRGGGGR